MQYFRNICLASSLFLTINVCASSQSHNPHTIDGIISHALHKKELQTAESQIKADQINQQRQNEQNHRNQLLQVYNNTHNPTDLENYLVAQSKNFYSKHRWTFLAPAGMKNLENFTFEKTYRQLASLVQTKHDHIQNYILESAEASSWNNIEDKLLAFNYDISLFDKMSRHAQINTILVILETNQLQYLPLLLTQTQAHDSCYRAALKLIDDRKYKSGYNSPAYIPKSLNNGNKITTIDVLLSNLFTQFNVNSTINGNNLLMDSIEQGAQTDDVTMLMDKGIDIHHENSCLNKNALDVAVIKYLQSYKIYTWSHNYEKDKAVENNLLATITLLSYNNVQAHEATISTCVKNMIEKMDTKNSQLRKQRHQDPELVQERMNQLKTIPVRFK